MDIRTLATFAIFCGSLLLHAGCGSQTTGSPNAAPPGAAANGNVPSNGVPTPDGTVAGAPAQGGNVLGQASVGNATVGPVIGPNHVAAIGMLGGPNNTYVLVGRFDATLPAAIRLSLPNSRIGATFTGTTLAVSMADDGVDLYDVVVDNSPSVVVTTAVGTAQTLYPIATNLSPGTHTVWLTKRTESGEQDAANGNIRTGVGTFGGFVLASGATFGTPPAPKGHLIVALGDSSFTGYGVGQLQSGGNTCVFSPATQNAQLSVPGQLATLMDAEVINVSASGKGIAQSAYDQNNPDQLPSLWQKAVPPAPTPAYSFPALDVDAVIVSAGSDDLIGAYGSGKVTDPNLFVAKYTALLADMRAHYPVAVLVGLINPNAVNTDKSTLTTLVGQAVSARNLAGDANVYAYDYFAGDANHWISYNDADAALGLGHGCQGHASPAGSLFLASRLAAFLRLHLTF